MVREVSGIRYWTWPGKLRARANIGHGAGYIWAIGFDAQHVEV